MKFGIGAAVERLEDPDLVTGQGRFLSDLVPEDAARFVVVRSPFAHGRFRLTNLDAVRAMPGVLAAISAEDTAHLGDLPCMVPVKQRDGSTTAVYPNPILPADTVRHVGEAMAVIVAETEAEARDASEAVMYDFDDLPVAIDPVAALDADAAPVWPEHGHNMAFDWELGDEARTRAAFDAAETVVEVTLVNNRVVANFMEPRGAIGSYDPETGRYHLTISSQGPHLVLNVIADKVFNLPRETFHIMTPDVGGGFGTKFFTYREYVLALVAAEKTGRTVAWIGDRTEHFLADYQGRDHVSKARLAIGPRGKFLGLDVDTIANMGAYLSHLGPFIPTNGTFMIPGVYVFPTTYARVRGVYTNTVPLDAYRGAGRPEAAYLIERLVDKAALETGIAPDKLRQRNFIKPNRMPFTTPTGRTYDTGDFMRHMTRAKETADWSGFKTRLRAARKRGQLRGIGMSTYIEACSGGGAERAVVSVDAEGGVTILVGTQTNGQGHRTAYAQLVAEHLGVDIAKVTLVQGDTDRIETGSGTGGSRSIPVGGASVAGASAKLAGTIKEKAADRLEAAIADLELTGGMIRIAGTDREVSLGEIAADAGGVLSEDEAWTPPAATYPNGTHVAEVEIDRETGVIRVVNFVVVDDFGVTLNPIMLEGQVHGGIAQGLGQAMLERTVYDEDSGQLITATLQDYCLPRADDLPPISFETANVPSTTNILGMKGAGEAGVIGSCPAIVNAIVDALHRAYGVTHVDMPATREVVWKIIREGEARAA